jgi:hypothetical protein
MTGCSNLTANAGLGLVVIVSAAESPSSLAIKRDGCVVVSIKAGPGGRPSRTALNGRRPRERPAKEEPGGPLGGARRNEQAYPRPGASPYETGPSCGHEVVAGARCPLTKPTATAVEQHAAIEPHSAIAAEACSPAVFACTRCSASRPPEVRSRVYAQAAGASWLSTGI